MAAERPELAGTRWTAVGVTDDIPLREGRFVELGGTALAVFNLGDRFLTVDNRCPHKGGPLSDGITTGGAVVCPLHGWRVNLTSGEVERPCAAAPAIGAYATKVVDGIVYVALDEPR
jgi:nitrite reductase (NADH) small subunit